MFIKFVVTIRPVPCGLHLAVSVPPESFNFSSASELLSSNETEILDTTSETTKKLKFTQDYLNDSVRDLNLSKKFSRFRIVWPFS